MNDTQKKHSHIQLKKNSLNQYISDVDTNLKKFREDNSEILSLFHEKVKIVN